MIEVSFKSNNKQNKTNKQLKKKNLSTYRAPVTKTKNKTYSIKSIVWESLSMSLPSVILFLANCSGQAKYVNPGHGFSAYSSLKNHVGLHGNPEHPVELPIH